MEKWKCEVCGFGAEADNEIIDRDSLMECGRCQHLADKKL